MTFNIKVNSDKTVTYDEIICNQFENEIDELVFDLPFDDYSYVAKFKGQGSVIEFPLVDKLFITNGISSKSGKWELIVIGKKEDKVFVSNTINFVVGRNFANLVATEEMDENIKTLYLQLEELLKKLDDTKIDEISSVVDELKAIQYKLDHLDIKATVDFTEVLEELDVLENDILTLKNKIDNLHIEVEVDLQPVLDAISSSQATIQGQIGSLSNQMSIHYSDLNTSISNLKLIVDRIPLSDYTDDLRAIKEVLDTIPTNDYTSDINIIKDQLTNVGVAGTIANNTKWSLTRAEEAKSISQQCYQLLTDVSLQLDEF